MSWNTQYRGPEIDAALEKGRGLRVVNNGWIRLESSLASPTDLSNLKNPGNYMTSFWTNGPDIGSTTVTPMNVTVITLNGETYQYLDIAGKKYSRKLNADGTFGTWAIDQTAGAINPGPDAPASPVDGKTMWLDTTTASAPVLKLYVNDEWKEVIPAGAMQASVYDPQGKKTDIFAYIDKAIEDASIGTVGIDFETHISDTTIHVTTAEKTKWNNSATVDDVNAAAAAMQGSLTTEITSAIGTDMQKVDDLTAAVTTTSQALTTHAGNTTIHPTSAKQAEWDGKATADHTHNLDGNVTVDTAHVSGEISGELLPYDTKERVYTVASDEERLALTKNPVHSGDAICVETDAGNTWYFVIDDSYLGNTEIVIDIKEGTLPETTANGSWKAVCYGNGKFVAIEGGNRSNKIAYSSDGITWVEVTISDTERQWSHICYGNGKFVASVGSSSYYFAYSLDGISWVEERFNTERNETCDGIYYGNDKFIFIVDGYYSRFIYSYDGISWVEGTISDTNRDWRSVCYGNDKFVAIANSSSVAAYSLDGINWVEVTISNTSESWQSVCYGNGKFVAVGYPNIFAYSLDGTTWTEGNLFTGSTATSWPSVCYGNGKFVAVSSWANYFAYSSDGVTWMKETISSTDIEFSSMCYANDKFIAINSTKYYIFTFVTQAENAFKQVSSGGGSLEWSKITGTPTTAAGYGITDAADQAQLDQLSADIAEAKTHIPDTTDFSSVTESQIVYNSISSGLTAIDNAFASMDELLAKLEAIAK